MTDSDSDLLQSKCCLSLWMYSAYCVLCHYCIICGKTSRGFYMCRYRNEVL